MSSPGGNNHAKSRTGCRALIVCIVCILALTLGAKTCHGDKVALPQNNPPPSLPYTRCTQTYSLESVSSGAAAVVFWIAVAGGGAVPLLEGGKFFMIFGLSYPAGMFAGMQVAEMWLDHLPPPVSAAFSEVKHL